MEDEAKKPEEGGKDPKSKQPIKECIYGGPCTECVPGGCRD